MKLNILIQGAGYQLSGEASSLTEFVELRDFLRREGLIGAVTQPGSGAPQDTKTEKDAGKAEEVKKSTETEKKAEPSPAASSKAGGKGKSDAKAAAATAKTAAGPTIEEVTAALTAVADKFGIQEALAMNQRFGVKKAGELNSEQYADYIAFANGCVADDRKPSQAQEDNASENEDDVSALV